MAQNTAPVYAKTPKIGHGGSVLGPSANTAQDGTGANITPIWQAEAVEGSWLDDLSFESVGSPAATVARIFLCSVTGAFTPGTSNTAANTFKIGEVSLPATTLSQTAAQNAYRFPVRRMIPAGWRVLVTFGTSTGAAGTGWVVGGFAADYA